MGESETEQSNNIAGTRSKRKRRNGDDDSSILLNQDEISILMKQVNEAHSGLLTALSNEKGPESKKKLCEFISTTFESLHKISTAYMHRLEIDKDLDTRNSLLLRACDNIERLSESITRYTQTQSAGPSFAQVVSSHTTSWSSRSVPARKLDRVTIGREDVKDKYKAPSGTKEMVKKSINPTELKLNVKRISYGTQNSVILEGPDLSSSAFTTCAPLLEAGLEIIPSVKMKPRIIVHDIP